MQTPNTHNAANRGKYLTTKTAFTVTLVVAALTILAIWLFGLGQHRTLFENSILSTTVLSVAFFLFLTIGLYHGVKLKDDVGRLTKSINLSNFPEFPAVGGDGDFSDAGDGIGGIILAILLWLLVTFLVALFIWVFGTLLWAGILAFIAMLYWIFFRAVRLVFKNGNKCRSKLLLSVRYALLYTILYNIWIYAVLVAAHYFIK